MPTPTLAQLLKQAIENRLLDVHTAIIGRVQKYDPSTQTADVEPVLKRSVPTLDGNLKQEDLPLLVDVPVLFPNAGGFFLSLPIKPGDYVQVIFNETSQENIYQQRFSLQEAVAIPGFYPIKNAHDKNLVLGKDEGVQIHIDSGKIRLGSEKADEALAIASKVKAELEKIKAAFNSHTHTGSCSTGAIATIATLTQIGTISKLATTKVVAE
jgi:hypothetical protein